MNSSNFILKPSRFLSPKKDAVFRHIFGVNSEITLSFINNILPFKIPLISVDYISETEIPHFNFSNYSSIHIKGVDMMEKVLIVSFYFIREEFSSNCYSFDNESFATSLKKYQKNINEPLSYPHYTLCIWDTILLENIAEWFHYGGVLQSLKPEIEHFQHELYFIELEKFKLKHQFDKEHISMGELWLHFFNKIHEDLQEFPSLYMEEPIFLQAMSLAQEVNFYDNSVNTINLQLDNSSMQFDSNKEYDD